MPHRYLYPLKVHGAPVNKYTDIGIHCTLAKLKLLREVKELLPWYLKLLKIGTNCLFCDDVVLLQP